jgi:uncharacterized SAM-binding protein YcdF (DUF218 family)
MSGAPAIAERLRPAQRLPLRRLARGAALATSALIVACLALGRWLLYPSDQQRADAIVILGGRYPERAEHGIALYQRGLASELWLTGDVPPPGAQLSQADRAARMAVARGLPSDAIQLLVTTSTWEDGQAIAALAREREIGRLLVVTDWTHSRRAICTIRQAAGPSVAVGYAPPPLAEYGPGDWWLSPSGIWALRRELPAILFYWLQYGISPFGC